MIYKTIISLTLLLFSLTDTIGQNRLTIEKKDNPSNIRYLNLDREYVIKTIDTTYYNKKIVGFNYSSISITIKTKTERDTSYSYNYKISKIKDTTYIRTEPIYRQDTLVIAFSDILELKNDWFENRQWLLPFGWIAIGAAANLVVGLPVTAIQKGADGLKEWAAIEAVLIVISAIPIFIGTRTSKYDLINKWTLKAE